MTSVCMCATVFVSFAMFHYFHMFREHTHACIRRSERAHKLMSPKTHKNNVNS